MTPQDPGVYISPAQMYDEVRNLSKAVDRIEQKIDSIIDETKDIRNDLADHESRIRSLERGRWPLPTVAALAGVGGAVTGALALFR